MQPAKHQGNHPTSTRFRGGRPLRLESLERREVLSAAPSVTLLAGLNEIYIQGTDFADQVEVRLNTGTNKLEVYATSSAVPPGTAIVPQLFDASKVNQILFDGGKGDDFFANNTGTICQATGGEGNDVLIGGADVDVFWGGDGDDWLLGCDGNDALLGERGSDVLLGGNGDDWLAGGADKAVDWLLGGPGKDTFFLPQGFFNGTEKEMVLDFTLGQDLLAPLP
jgi:Ca2+-binding RTX toxin-like protein